MRPRHTKKLVSGGIGLIALACLWFYFAPVGLGGSTSYVVTDGISMEPRFHAGDLVLVRSQSSYQVGEIVAYRSTVLHTVVLHRIVGRVGARYVFKGDNNNFIDPWHPARSQLLGALWLSIPGAGARLNAVRSPALIGALVGLATLLLAGAAFTRRRRLRRRQRRTMERPRRPVRGWPRLSSGSVAWALAIDSLALFAAVALALLAFTRPSVARLPFAASYVQSGRFSYSAEALPGPAYAGNRAVTGNPLFTRVIGAVEFSFAYQLHTAAGHSLKGKAALYATIASTNGWQKTFALGRPRDFRGDRALLSARLDLTALLGLLRRVEATTAVSGTYTLTLVPHVSTTGRLDQLPLSTSFSPRLQFSLNLLELQPVLAAAGSLAGGQPGANPFADSDSGSVTGTQNRPLSLSLGVAQLSVASARRIGLGAIAIFAYMLLLIWELGRPGARDESAAIRARYGRLIVPVRSIVQPPGVPVIELGDIRALVGIAERYDRSIMHELTAEGEAFWVSDESGQFRYVVSAPAYEDEEIVEEEWSPSATTRRRSRSSRVFAFDKQFQQL